ncbi:MAG TPA: energy transducer TonB, partial [Myxococcaceae bacterium]|nr:energy transducer TonB [Myxococcaceae bacterium]
DLYGPYGIRDEQKTRATHADGSAIPQSEEARPVSEQKFPVRLRCVLRTDGTLHQCYVSARTAEVAEAAGRAIPSARFKPAVAHGHPVSSVFQFNTSIVTRPAQP